jgi:hypothetical protein
MVQTIRVDAAAAFDEAYRGMAAMGSRELEEMAVLLCDSETDAAASDDLEGAVIAGMGMRAALASLRFVQGPQGERYQLAAYACGYERE